MPTRSIIHATAMPRGRAGVHMTEGQLQAAVVEAAQWLGFRCYHTHDSRHSAAGWPDLALCHRCEPRFLLVELKSDTGRLTPDQSAWLADLKAAGIECHVWTPADWHSGVIERVLRGDGY